MYSTMTACLCFHCLKFDIFDAMVFRDYLSGYHVLRTGRFPRLHWHLTKLISSFLISAKTGF